MNHTKEPWEPKRDICHFGTLSSVVSGDKSVAEVTGETLEEQEANLERIIACVNACKGIKTEALNKGIINDLFKEYFELADIHELEHLLSVCEGEWHSKILESLNNSWDDIDKMEISKE